MDYIRMFELDTLNNLAGADNDYGNNPSL